MHHYSVQQHARLLLQNGLSVSWKKVWHTCLTMHRNVEWVILTWKCSDRVCVCGLILMEKVSLPYASFFVHAWNQNWIMHCIMPPSPSLWLHESENRCSWVLLLRCSLQITIDYCHLTEFEVLKIEIEGILTQGWHTWLPLWHYSIYCTFYMYPDRVRLG